MGTTTSTCRSTPHHATGSRPTASPGARRHLRQAGVRCMGAGRVARIHSAVQTEEAIEQRRGYCRRAPRSGVCDDSAPGTGEPVATTDGLAADLTVPGRPRVPSWAISGVTVAPTHRRRGVARRSSRPSSAPLRLRRVIATLTVSESTIYGRFGFGPAALARDLTIDTRRARWTVRSRRSGPLRPRRQLIERRPRPRRARTLATRADRLRRNPLGPPARPMVDDEDAKKQRIVRYDDAAGRMQGFASYSSSRPRRLHPARARPAAPRDGDRRRIAASGASCWRWTCLRGQGSPAAGRRAGALDGLGFRAVKVAELDHLWIRILDVPAALEARTYAAPGRLVLGVSDPFGAGRHVGARRRYRGPATVAPTAEPADVSHGWSSLATIYLGGVHRPCWPRLDACAAAPQSSTRCSAPRRAVPQHLVPTVQIRDLQGDENGHRRG